MHVHVMWVSKDPLWAQTLAKPIIAGLTAHHTNAILETFKAKQRENSRKSGQTQGSPRW